MGTTLLPQGRLHSRTGLIVSGAVDLHDPDLDMAVHLQPGDMFGFGATPAQHLTTWQATAAADSHIAWLAPDTVTALCRDHGALAYFFPSLPGVGQPPAAVQAPGAGVHLNLLGTPVRALIKREPITLPPDTSIRAAALQMRDLRVSSVLLVEQHHLFGLVTDRDLRNRVVALGLDIDRPVSDIATLAPMPLMVGLAGWLVFTDSELHTRQRLLSQGQSSLIISASEYQGHIEGGELVKPLTLYVRGDEQVLAEAAFARGLLLSQGNKKTTLVKHHKAYRLMPGNAQPALALLAS